MTLAEALDTVVSRTGHARYRELCDPTHPDYNPAYVPVVMRQAGHPDYPPLATQIGNVVVATGRFVASGFALVDQAERDRRKAICEAPCEHFDAAQDRCRACGCSLAIKPWGARENCPIGKW